MDIRGQADRACVLSPKVYGRSSCLPHTCNSPGNMPRRVERNSVIHNGHGHGCEGGGGIIELILS